MTNLEVIKQKVAEMTAEELAKFMDGAHCERCAWRDSHECDTRTCQSGYEEWLAHKHIPTVKRVEKQKTVTEIHLMCSCGGEYFEEIGMGLSTTYHHRCNRCGNVIDCNDGYPRLKE